ncbi:MAG: hypothetical protein GXP63_03220 [DPANN group archaeon]|nr:hypothetical protein [DPANN group archaeon]
MKKAQMEMMGLVIIVILITMIFLFVVKFDISKEPATQRKDFIHSELAANTLNAILKMDSRCDKLSMTELFQDCGRGAPMVGKTKVQCDNTGSPQDSCLAINSTVLAILNQTLFMQQISYNFTVKSTTEPDQNYLTLSQVHRGDSCSKSRKTEVYPIPLDPKTMFVRLEICS